MNKIVFKILMIMLSLFVILPGGVNVYAQTVQIGFEENGESTDTIHLGTFHAKATVTGCRGENLSLITAVYCDNRLEDVTYESFEHDNEEYTFNGSDVAVGKDMVNPHVKAFVWNGQNEPFGMAEPAVYCSKQGKPVSGEIHKALERFDTICTQEVLTWLASLYDLDTGGFYYSCSARDYEGFLPDLESTSQAFTLMRESGLIPHGVLGNNAFPPTVRNKTASFVQGLQSDDDGYFYHPQWGSDIAVSRRERDLSSAKELLYSCNADPLYELPEERIAAISLMSLPDYTNSAKFIDYLNSLDFSSGSSAYASANELTSSINTIRSAGLLEETIEFLKSKQDATTGLWEAPGELSRSAVNAAMKASSFFLQSTGEPYQYFDKIVDSVKYVVENERPNTASALWNPARLWVNAIESLDLQENNIETLSKVEAFLPALINEICDEAIYFKKPDGGFSYYMDKSIKTSQGSEVSLGLSEGDVNATLLCTERIRNSCYSLAGIKYDNYFEKYKDEFFEQLENAESVVKTPRAVSSFSEDFNLMSIGSAPLNWTVNGSGIVNVQSFPLTDSSALCVESVGSGNINAQRPLLLLEDYESVDYEFDICLTNSRLNDKYERWSVYLGKYAAEFIIDGRNSDDYIVYWRTASTPLGSLGKNIATLSAETPYSFKIQYSPSGTVGKRVRLYIGNELIYETDEYYDMSNDAVKRIGSISFYGWSDTCGKLMADNIRLSEVVR